MCGLFGALSFDASAIDPAHAERMSACVARRGPDDKGEFFDGPVMLGHRRLAIIDLSPAGHQPMHDVSRRYTIVFNGTIYNYPELRETLIGKGYRFHSHSDTEVILNAYACWGDDCVARLHGMFAFAIWDSKRRNLFLARDRMGIKPLYFARAKTGFYFASNPQALLATGLFATDIDPVGLHHQLSLHAVIPAPRTLLRAIGKCRPAYYMNVRPDGSIREDRYWTLIARRPEQERSAEEWNDAIHQALMQAVKKRLTIADVPVGVLLSGGLDSSLLVALLAEAGQSDIRTFSIGFEDQPEERGNEFEFSDPVAERYSSEHKKFLIPNAKVLTRSPEAVEAMAEPMFGQDAVAFYLLSEQVSKSVKVVQSGQGADEVFAGYFWYGQMAAAADEPALERFASRYVDRDLNREWSVESVDEFRTRNPEQDGAEDREQRELLKFIDALENETDQSIVFLDLHSTSAPGLPFACMPDTIENLSIALRIPVPAVLGLEETIRGPLLGWLSDRGFAGIIVEGGQHVDPDTPDILESAIWALLVSLGCLHASEVAYYDEHVGRLEDKSAGLPRVLEVKLRHQVTAADNFVMRRGFKHYDRVHQGQHLADDTSGKIRASISGRILMPAYGENTEQGFFIVRDVNSFKVRILFLLRSLGLDRFCHLLPGVKVNPVSDDILHVAGWVPKRLVDIIRLLGWRRSAHSESSTVLKRRHTHVRLRDG